MTTPTFEEAKRYAADYKRIPIAFDLLLDTHTPIQLFLSILDRSDNCFLLESAENANQWGRYSFIGYRFLQEIQVRGNSISIRHQDGSSETRNEDPFTFLRTLMAQNSSPRMKNMPHLTGGLVGYFGYDAVRVIEPKLTNVPCDDLGLPDCHLLLCEELIAFDHSRHCASIIVNAPTEGDFEANYRRAQERAKEIARELIDAVVPPRKKAEPAGEMEITSNRTKEQYMQSVEAAKEYIKSGDVFQIVLSQRFEVHNPPDSFDVYRALRATNPSPYMYYFKLGETRIAGASPEMLVSVADGVVYTRPIAGTMPRGADEAEDLALENRLITDPKELAEHTMLVDLGRNDVGKVSKFGTVEVTRLMAVERYSAVMHIVSDVRGELRGDKTGIDAITAVLPAGTLSGAPKVRAMELIDQIEPNKRCLYGGMVGYIGLDGHIDTCIAIRTVLFQNGKAYVQAGAGIVADSVPEAEFEETHNKARAMINAIKRARELQ